MANVGLQFLASAGDADPQSRPLLLLGQLPHLHRVPWSHVRGKLQPRVTEELWQAALSTLNPNPTDSCPLYLNCATVATLPSRVSRHNSPSAAHFVTRLVRTCLPPGTHRCILLVCERSDVFALACALARAFPLFTRRSGATRRTEKKTVTVEFFLVGQDNGPVEVSTLQVGVPGALPSLSPSTARPSSGLWRCPLCKWVSLGHSLPSSCPSPDLPQACGGVHSASGCPWATPFPHPVHCRTFHRPVEVSTLQCLVNATEGVRLAARIVDTPCNEMNTDTFLEEIKKVGKDLGITPAIIRDEELKTRGFGGIYGVGKAALHPPALAVLSHTPEGATQTIAWVGKGIVYDTGGLSIKGKTTMPGMKRDCGGAAAILGAFRAAVKQGFKDNLHAVFCLAENAVGPSATRPDDIHLLYSGKTVEINNTDAEGRLVLADGVVYACKDLGADIILDIATLTGAQGIATGKYHAAVLTNSAEWEAACVKAGRKCGDLVHPLVYCPELHFSEFTSAVADMKNSVADRDNSPSSCAGLFIASHIGFDWPGVWVHLDIAAPVHAGERATGFGVALLLALFGRASEDPLLNLVSPLGCEADTQAEDMERDSKRRRLV
ncbi:probable aminopeptidase NPEPL1 isoform X2 [Elephas maximus indicus]|uniref:probable aminopeptidase NPEPL1 isoform X2 n=1 Tax=Elephas maximus indicus TaxID=99487 RepID=UPI0021163D1E|nr:probable aminopeptidase NPEPL1 isoform X2 [Elephas maximus indicus]